jgi:hypothetical protein
MSLELRAALLQHQYRLVGASLEGNNENPRFSNTVCACKEEILRSIMILRVTGILHDLHVLISGSDTFNKAYREQRQVEPRYRRT